MRKPQETAASVTCEDAENADSLVVPDGSEEATVPSEEIENDKVFIFSYIGLSMNELRMELSEKISS